MLSNISYIERLLVDRGFGYKDILKFINLFLELIHNVYKVLV